jgi:hypothetical protein
MSTRKILPPALAALAFVVAGVCALPAGAQTTVPAKAPKAVKKAAARVEAPVPDAGPEQAKAAEMVYYGKYDCEFNQSIDITQSPKHSAYVDLRIGKSDWLMKPVLSSTGAIRLEDVKGETLLVQIAAKSMLLNVKSGHRIVDACVSPRQRELNEAAQAAKAANPS